MIARQSLNSVMAGAMLQVASPTMDGDWPTGSSRFVMPLRHEVYWMHAPIALPAKRSF